MYEMKKIKRQEIKMQSRWNKEDSYYIKKKEYVKHRENKEHTEYGGNKEDIK